MKCLWLICLVGALGVPASASAQDWGGWGGWGGDLFLPSDLECVPLSLGQEVDEIVIEVSNTGFAYAPSTWLDVFIDVDLPRLQLGDTSDTFVATKPLAPGQSVRYAFHVPPEVIDGADPHYEYGCIIDTFDQVFEIEEEDNNVYHTYRQVF